MEITGHQLLLFLEAASSSAIKFLMSVCTHKTEQAQWAVGFGVWLKAQPPLFGVTQLRAAGGREGMPCTGSPAAVTVDWRCLQQEEYPNRMRRDRLGGSTCSQASPDQPLPPSLLPQAPPIPGRATRELAAGGSSLGRLPKLPLQLFLTPIRLQQALGSTGRGSCISGGRDKVTSGAVR